MNNTPASHDRIIPVTRAEELDGDFTGSTACKLFRRSLSLDFNPLAAWLERAEVRNGLFRDMGFDALAVTVAYMPPGEKAAAEFILNDMDILRPRHRILRVIRRYKDSASLAFHIDPLPLVCGGYTGPMTTYIDNDDAVPVPGKTADFTPRDGAEILSFRPGDLWCQRGAVEGGKNAFIHNGPAARSGAPARLLLIGHPR